MSFAILAISSPSLAAKQPQLSPMEIQAIQQKEFETPKSVLFSSVVDVFQDLGYTINSADIHSGFINAESTTVNKTSLIEALAEARSSGNTRATAFIEQMPSGMARVRLNFVASKTMSMTYGQTSKRETPILDAEVYRRAYEKIDEAIFVRTATSSIKTPNSPPIVETPK